jgi:DNA-binding XRE family transcriptional regulator
MMRTTTKERAIQCYRDFGQRLRALRQLRGYTEQDAAATAEVTLRTWRRWEAGCVGRGDSQWIIAFSEEYAVSYMWLLSGKGPMALSDYRAQIAELKALPPFVAEQMVCGNRPMLRLVKSGPGNA